MLPITYIEGDATQPIGTGNRIIVHCCNDRGFWNAGFVRALSSRYPQPERAYRRWSLDRDPIPFRLGQIQFVKVEPGLCVANLIGQAGIRSNSNSIPLRYDALREGLARVRELALKHDANIHMPRIGAGLAGGDWQPIAQIIESELCSHGLNVNRLRPPSQKLSSQWSKPGFRPTAMMGFSNLGGPPCYSQCCSLSQTNLIFRPGPLAD